MRRSIGLCLSLMFLAACGEMEDSSPLGVPPDEGPGSSATNQIVDGAHQEEGEANSSFYFLSPVAENNPDLSDAPPQDDDAEPVVRICYWDAANQSCGDELVKFTTNPEDNENGDWISVTEGMKYGVVWKTNDYPVVEGDVFRIGLFHALPGGEELLGAWALVQAEHNQAYSSYHYTPDGYIAISDNGNLNINFTIRVDWLDSVYCQEGVEDCTARLFHQDGSGCLDVYQFPGTEGQLPGSRACVSENANPMLGPDPVGMFAVVLTLEEETVETQGAAFPSPPIPDLPYELPYFSDVSFFPQGITFDSNGDGLQLTVCQWESYYEELEATSGVEDLLFAAGLYLVYSGPTSSQTVVLKPSADGTPGEGEYVFDPTACMDEAPIASAPQGFLGRLASGFASVKDLFRPTPLVARRIHGGLNTTVYGDAPPGGGDAVAAFAGEAGVSFEGEEVEIGAGFVLNVDIDASDVAIEPEAGLMLEPATITVTPKNALGEVIPYDVTVTVSVTGANSEELEALDPDGDGIYEVTYTPLVAGTDYIQAFIDGVAFPEPFEYYVAPLSGVIEVYVEIDPSSIPASETNDPAVGLPVNLYDADGTFLEMTTTQATGTWGEGVATFGSEEAGTYLFGDYTASLPKRDFDFAFETDSNGDEIYEQAVGHSADPTVATFTGSLMDLGEGWDIYRIGAPLNGDAFGSGNVYRNVEDTRSWFSAQNQIRGLTLPDAYEDVPAHLVTIKTAGENAFVGDLVKAQCSPETDAKKCKSQAWIGLSDEEIDGSFEWVNEEGYLNPCTPSDPRPSSPFFFGWADKEPSGRNNEDQVEINLVGEWFDENGASSTNDGYIIEFKAWQPQEDPPLMCPGS